MIFFLILLVVFGLILNSVRKVYIKKREAEKALALMQKEAKDLADREIYLERSLQRLETEEGIKFEIRKKLNVAEVGESVAIIVDEEKFVKDNSIKNSAWQKLKSFFVGWFD